MTSRRSRDDGVAEVVFERPSTPPVGFAATAVPHDYIKTVFCDLDRLLSFLRLALMALTTSQFKSCMNYFS